jgi:hypothetical protein
MYYSLKEISSILNGIIDRFQAKNIRFNVHPLQTSKTEYLSLDVTCIAGRLDGNFNAWPQANDGLPLSFFTNLSIFESCNNLRHYRAIDPNDAWYKLDKSDIDCLTMLSKCNSLEEAQVQCDLTI